MGGQGPPRAHLQRENSVCLIVERGVGGERSQAHSSQENLEARLPAGQDGRMKGEVVIIPRIKKCKNNAEGRQKPHLCLTLTSQHMGYF